MVEYACPSGRARSLENCLRWVIADVLLAMVSGGSIRKNQGLELTSGQKQLKE